MGGGEHFPSGPYAVPLGEPNNVRHDLEREHEGERERELEREGERARGRGREREREWGEEEEEEEEEEREREREREEERAREREREREEEERERERREPTIKGELVKIYPQANPRFYLTAEGDTVVLSKGEDDTPKEDQLWYKDDSTGDRVKDSEGHPAFVLVNKASHLALKHVADDRVQVSLATFREGAVDDSLLWTLSDDVGDGYRAIRPVNNTKLNLDADHADKEHGGVKEHNRLILFKWKKQDNQKWKLVPVTV